MLAQTAVKMPELDVFRPQLLTNTPVTPSRTNGSSYRARYDHYWADRRPPMQYDSEPAVGSGPNLEEILWTLYAESGRFINTSSFAVAIHDDCTDTLAFPLVFDRGERVEPWPVKLSNHQGLVGLVLTSQTPLLIQDLPKAGIIVEADPICPGQPIRSWLSVPIRSPTVTDGKAQGVVVVWSDQPNAFTQGQLRLLSALGALAGMAIHNAGLFETENAHLRKSVLDERKRIVEAEKQIRKELAHNLHDGPTQLVSGIIMSLDYCRQVFGKNSALLPQQLNYMQELAEHAMRQMRTLLFELRPTVLETEGLNAALQALIEHRQKATKTTELTLHTETCQPGGEISRQEVKVEATIFAVVQEAVTNALKHASADHIEIYLKETPAEIRVTIVDDGKGFDVDTIMHNYEQRGSLGMVTIRERTELIGGELDIKSVPGCGTRITVKVPKALERGKQKQGMVNGQSDEVQIARRRRTFLKSF